MAASRRALAAALVAALATIGDAKPRPIAPAPMSPHVAVDPRAALVAQVAAEQATLATTIDTVAGKLAAADATRLRRIRAALRLFRAPPLATADADDRMTYARRLGAARYLLARDAAERGLLADEVSELHAAERTAAAAHAIAPSIALPTELGWPAAGAIARHFGEYQHERSKATLSRRGLDFDVEDHAAALAPADGLVRYAGPIRGLDRGAIIDCGSYMTVIAKLGELAVPVGARVSRGDRLGRAASHRVYLEVRAKVGPGGLPIDPEPLLKR